MKRIVCLANSRKLNGRCIAGRELVQNRPAGWLRPVSEREHEEVSEYERQYEDGSDPRVGEIIDIPVLAPRPKDYQQENWLLDPQRYWLKVGQTQWDDLQRLEEPAGSLWINGHSTYSGSNDKVPLESAAVLSSSLRLIRVEALELSVFAPGEAFGNSKRRLQARFLHNQLYYALWVTDPVYETRYSPNRMATISCESVY